MPHEDCAFDCGQAGFPSRSSEVSFPPSLRQLCLNLEGIFMEDTGRRGLGPLFPLSSGGLLKATQLLRDKRHVCILTGFYIPPAETDGPPGAVAIARALAGLGKKVTLVTDSLCINVLRSAVNASLGIGGLGASTVKIVTFEVDGTTAEDDILLANRILDDVTTDDDITDGRQRAVAVGPVIDNEAKHGDDVTDHVTSPSVPVDAVLSIERCGPAADGEYYRMIGRCCSHTCGRVVLTATEAARRGVPLIAIGDGGNEIGMGNVVEVARGCIPLGEKICCVVTCDALVVAGVSNWGGYAVACALIGQSLAEMKQQAQGEGGTEREGGMEREENQETEDDRSDGRQQNQSRKGHVKDHSGGVGDMRCAAGESEGEGDGGVETGEDRSLEGQNGDDGVTRLRAGRRVRQLLDLAPTSEMEGRVLDAMLAAGGKDAMLPEGTRAVDGLMFDTVHRDVLVRMSGVLFAMAARLRLVH